MGCGDETRRGGTGDWGGTGFRCVHSTGREPSWLCSGNDCRKLVSKGGPRRVRLRSRVDHGRQPRRQPFYPGFCGQWWTQYRGPAGYVDVSITIYRTSRQVDAPLREPAYLSLRVLGNGARVRSASDGSGVVSGMRNVFVSSVSSFLPADVNVFPRSQEGLTYLFAST